MQSTSALTSTSTVAAIKRKVAGVSFISYETKPMKRKRYVDRRKAANEQEYARRINIDVREHAYDHCCNVVDQLYESVMNDAHAVIFDQVQNFISDSFYQIDNFVEEEQILPLVVMRVSTGGLGLSDRVRSLYWNLCQKNYAPCYIRISACKNLATLMWGEVIYLMYAM